MGKHSKTAPYPVEQTCDSDYSCNNPDHPKGEYGYCTLPTDDGTMPENVESLSEHVVGHRIVSAQKEVIHRGRYYGAETGFVLTLDNGKRVALFDGGDCCAYTELENFFLDPNRIDHIITGVGTTEGYTRWHIYADLGDVLEMEVGWSCGNPFYYGYGFDIYVLPIGESE